MSYTDDDSNTIFPTRQGTAMGGAQERKMLDHIGGAGQIRKSYITNPDGTTTMLHTRGNGMAPEFITLKPIVAAVLEVLRGFFVVKPSASSGVLFSTVDLSVRKSPFALGANKYYVADFVSSFNGDSNVGLSHNDVWSSRGGKLYINNKTYSDFGTVQTLENAVPYIIRKPDNSYGSLAENTVDANRRVFTVGSQSVAALTDGSSSISYSLKPELPRTELRAFVCGPSIDKATNTAKLSQIWFAGTSWDDPITGWGYSKSAIQMTLTSPRLVSVDYAISAEGVTAPIALVSSAPYSTNTPYTPAPAPQCAVGYMQEYSRTNHSTWGTTVQVNHKINTLSEIRYVAAMEDSHKASSGNDAIYEGASTLVTETPVGNISTTVTVYRRSKSTNENALAILPGITPAEVPVSNAVPVRYSTRLDNGSPPFFSNNDPVPAAAYGDYAVFSNPLNIGFSSGLATSLENFSEVHSVTNVDGFSAPLSLVSATITDISGTRSRLSPVSGVTITQFTSPPYVVSELMYDSWIGDLSTALKIAYFTEAGAHVNALANQVAGKPGYFLGRLSAVGYVSDNYSVSSFSASLEWETRDFILFDKEEQVFVYVLAELTGGQSGVSGATSLLTVSLVVDVRGDVVQTTMFTKTITEGNLLLTEPMGLGTSLDYLPAPQSRNFFTPLFMMQGDFPGAAYTTANEILNGADPTSVFNFSFRLGTFYDVGGNPTSPELTVIPFNLLDRLYGYVFSKKYGVDATDRYPVDATATFTEFMTTLFATSWHVKVRDGAISDWTSGFGSTYLATNNTNGVFRS